MLEAVLWKKSKECIPISSKKQELARSIHAGCFTVFHVFQQYAANGVMACFLCPSSGFLHSTFLLLFQFRVRFQREDSTKKRNIFADFICQLLTHWPLHLMTSKRPTGTAQTVNKQSFWIESLLQIAQLKLQSLHCSTPFTSSLVVKFHSITAPLHLFD